MAITRVQVPEHATASAKPTFKRLKDPTLTDDIPPRSLHLKQWRLALFVLTPEFEVPIAISGHIDGKKLLNCRCAV